MIQKIRVNCNSTIKRSFCFLFWIGNGLIDEAEFLQWIARIQAIKDESASSSSSSSSNQPVSEEDDITQDLVAAFRYILGIPLSLRGIRWLKDFFRVFDRDGNGYITRDELQTAMDMIGENVTEAQLTEMLALADLDKDGRINYEGKPNLTSPNITYKTFSNQAKSL